MKNILIVLGCIAVAVAVVIIGVYKKGQNQVEPDSASGGTVDSVVLETISGSEFVAKWSELKDSGAKMIDVRTPAEYNAGHYEGAEMIDFYASDFKEQLDKLDKDTQYFIYCRSGSRSGQALQIMRELGFNKVYNLAGGFAGNGAILPIVK